MEKRNRLTVKECANLLGIDVLTVRVLLREGLVPWGTAYKLPGSNHFSYLIYAGKFFAETGIKPKDGDFENHG